MQQQKADYCIILHVIFRVNSPIMKKHREYICLGSKMFVSALGHRILLAARPQPSFYYRFQILAGDTQSGCRLSCQ